MQVDLLVTPVELEQRLETLEISVQLAEGTFEDTVNNLSAILEQWVVRDPRLGVQVERVRHVPRLTDDVVPVFKLVPVRSQLLVLAPALERLDLLETLREGLDDDISVFVGAGAGSEPVLLDTGHSSLPDRFSNLLLVLSSGLSFFFFFIGVFEDQVSQRVKVLNLGRTSRRQAEFFNLAPSLHMFEDFFLFHLDFDVEEGLEASGSGRGVRVTRVSGTDFLDVTRVIKLAETSDHGVD